MDCTSMGALIQSCNVLGERAHQCSIAPLEILTADLLLIAQEIIAALACAAHAHDMRQTLAHDST